MKALIIDDEQLAINVLDILLQKIPNIEVVGSFTNPQTALKELPKLTVDLIFLDMEMGEIHGLEFAEVLLENYPDIEIVFVTAHPQFALEAFGVNAIDYLLKPVDKDRLAKTIEKLNRRHAGKMSEADLPGEKALFAEVMGNFRLLDHKGVEVKWRTRKVKELFILLWQYKKKGIHRSQIIMDLWPNSSESKATSLMHTTIYQLRKLFRDMGFKKPVILKNEQYKLSVPIKSDLEQLVKIIELPGKDEEMVKEALQLYKDDYLAIENYEWAFPVQGKVQRLFLSYLEEYIFTAKLSGVKNNLIESCLKRMIDLDPYNIQYVCLLIEYYGDKGSTQRVITSFQEAKLRWIDELGLDMPREITEVYHHYT